MRETVGSALKGLERACGSLKLSGVGWGGSQKGTFNKNHNGGSAFKAKVVPMVKTSCRASSTSSKISGFQRGHRSIGLGYRCEVKSWSRLFCEIALALV